MNLSNTNGPVLNRQTMYSAANDSRELDPYGKFPVVCPNGSGHSIRLGNNTPGGEAEGISYEFKIPANENAYSLIYHYAVVFQSPNHRLNEQPRMEIEVMNVTDNSLISCSSFTFIAVGSAMPGFAVSDQSDTTSVLYKDWSAVSVDLSGMAGKTIRLMFKTGDCTFRRHFGYAYIDVDSECSTSIIGSSYCPNDTLVNLIAPFGYQSYEWYNENFTQLLGTQQKITLSPPPTVGSTIAVKLLPYEGFGCPLTIQTKLTNDLTVSSSAGKDALSCNNNPVLIGTTSKLGLEYRWSPTAGLSNPTISNPFAAPDVTTPYVLTVSSAGGGCSVSDTVIIAASFIDDSLQVIGKPTFCIDNGDSALLRVNATDNIQWYKNNTPINGADETDYRVTSSGVYHALMKNEDGCVVSTEQQSIVIDKAKPGIAYPVKYAVVDLPLSLKAREIGEQVLWTPAINLNNATTFKPVFTSSAERQYAIEIRTATECLTIDTQLVKIVKSVEIYVPNAFTPNGDGKNDFLRPHLRGISELHYFKIFNRWGQLLYDNRSDEAGWDGSFRGTPQSTQTYVWILEGVGVDNRLYTRKGICTLIR